MHCGCPAGSGTGTLPVSQLEHSRVWDALLVLWGACGLEENFSGTQ